MTSRHIFQVGIRPYLILLAPQDNRSSHQDMRFSGIAKECSAAGDEVLRRLSTAPRVGLGSFAFLVADDTECYDRGESQASEDRDYDTQHLFCL